MLVYQRVTIFPMELQKNTTISMKATAAKATPLTLQSGGIQHDSWSSIVGDVFMGR